ncbi:MBL fold metallo-hydrolase RNA specificity domain-containing protein [Nocardioides sp. Root151]|uniref:MBL fold metallo-hydrolase RNA specificity domain-containing protein n=1 Tax=Nocardioides sp. Root151 TaxID=1736475 RepID=UPI0007038278|nr:MBL fold metallo-hydrolase [Nocardioides sp. Root151]KQZ70350.1 MBL fold metallo-hydrolase [Nocardioides sp. Root151]
MSNPMTLTFLGAAGTVTGSKFLLEHDGRRILVDAGLFQGESAWRRRNWEPPPLDPSTLDAVVLTHAHLDHSGYLPVLAREGFAGHVTCTSDTARLAAIVLRDAAHLQEEEARWARSTGLSKHERPRPLFDSADAERAIALLRPVARHEEIPLGGEFTAELFRAGHILGSSFVAISRGATRLVFSGDLGRTDHPLLRAPEHPGRADHFVVESTYGNREHHGHGSEELAGALERTLRRGGVALLPAFAVDRTPMVLHEIQRLVRSGQVQDVPVYVDSPMALSALQVYQAALRATDTDFRDEIASDSDPFDPGKLRLVSDPDESRRLNDPRHPCILVSASGMATGGRVLHHLEHQLPMERNSVILTGYQVAGTRGRFLADGARAVKIHGRYVPVRAEVVNVRGFSAHADASQMIEWLRPSPSPRTTFVVHGEPHSAQALAERLREELSWTAVVPGHEERVLVD